MKRVLSWLLTVLIVLIPCACVADEVRTAGYDVEAELKAYNDVMRLNALEELWALADENDHTAAWFLDTFKIDMRNLEVDLSGNYADTVRARVAAGDLPDMIMTYNRSLALELADTGEFLNLAPYIDKYAPDLRQYIGEEVLEKYLSADGGLYILPGDTAPIDELDKYLYAQDAFMVNTELLEMVNMEAPTNTEELYAYLKAISGLEINGQSVIPIANSAFLPGNYKNTDYPVNTDKQRMMFMFEPGTGYHYLVKNDETQMIDLAYDHPTYLKYLKFFSKLYREGLLDQDIFTMSSDQYMERMKTGVYGCLFDSVGNTATANTAYSGVINKPYWPIVLPRDYEGSAKSFTFGVLGGWYFMFNKNISDPDRLAKLLNWNYTLDGVRVINYGAPDESMTMNCWYYDDNGEIVFDQDLQRQWDAEDYSWNWSRAGGWGYHAAGLKKQVKYTSPVNEMGLCMADDMYLAVDDMTKNDLTVDASFEAMMLQPKGEYFTNSGAALCDLLNKWDVRIVLRAKDDNEVESMYEQMMQEARNMGYDTMKQELYSMYLAANS